MSIHLAARSIVVDANDRVLGSIVGHRSGDWSAYRADGRQKADEYGSFVFGSRSEAIDVVCDHDGDIVWPIETAVTHWGADSEALHPWPRDSEVRP